MVVRVWLCRIHGPTAAKLLDGSDPTPRCGVCRAPLEVVSYGTDGPGTVKR
jgi:hypothetical protein